MAAMSCFGFKLLLNRVLLYDDLPWTLLFVALCELPWVQVFLAAFKSWVDLGALPLAALKWLPWVLLCGDLPWTLLCVALCASCVGCKSPWLLLNSELIWVLLYDDVPWMLLYGYFLMASCLGCCWLRCKLICLEYSYIVLLWVFLHCELYWVFFKC